MSRRGGEIVPRPFLKWAGGKGQLLDALVARVEAAGPFGRYHEPFVGGGALFFELVRTGRLKQPAFLSDNNANLIDAYRGVKRYVGKVIELLLDHKARHSPEYYYQVRGCVPNTLAECAARIIYLNKTCYNGLFRENSKGEFNVPVGSYVNPMVCDEGNLRACAKALRSAAIGVRPFQDVVKHAKSGDLVYFDPPYHPLSKTASFTAYDKHGFGINDQERLAKVFAELSSRGVRVLLSNSMTPLVKDLYEGFTIETVYANRSVNSKADRRGKIPEALVRNF